MSKNPAIQFLFFFLIICIPVSEIIAQTGSIPTGSDTTCANAVSIFQKLYGGNKDDIAYDLALAADSGYVAAGQTKSFGVGGYDGLLIKVDKRGTVVWSKAIGGAGNDVFYGILKTSDNGFITCGQTKSFGNSAGDAWLVKIDATGTVQWSKKYGDGNADGEVAWDVIQLSDGGFAFCGAHRFASGVSTNWVVRTDNLGNVTWSKQYDHSASDEAWALMEDGNILVVVGWETSSSFYDGHIMKIDKATGALQLIKGFDAEGRSTMPAGITKTSTGYQVFSIVMDDYNSTNVQHEIWNLNTDGTVQNVRKVNIPGIQTNSFGWLAQPDGGFVSVNSQDNNTGDILISQVNANGNLAWSKKLIRNGKQWTRNMVSAPYGGYALAGNNNNVGTFADSNNVYLLRIDSLGEGGVCSGINTTDVTISVPAYTTPSTSAVTFLDVATNNPAITVTVTSFSPTTNVLCTDCRFPIPPIPPDTTCTNGIPMFQKLYGGTKDDYSFEIALSADSGYVVAGQTNSTGNGGYDGLLMKVSKKGNVVWTKAIGGSGNDVFYGIKKTSDDGFIVCGQTKSYGNPAGDVWLVKVDASGAVQWSKKYGDGNANGETSYDVIQLSDGGYAFCGAHRYAAGVTEGFVVRTDNLGNPIWSKQYGHVASDEIWGITEDGNSIVAVGWYTGSSFYDGALLKLDKATGALQSIKGYKAEGRSTLLAKVRKTNSGYQVLSLIMDDFTGTNVQHGIWNLNTDGTVQNLRKMVIPGIQTYSYGWLPSPDGGFVSVNSEDNDNGDILISKVNANGSLAWSKRFLRTGRQWVRSMVAAAENGYALGANNNSVGSLSDSNNVYMMRLDTAGNAGSCSGINTNDVTVTTPAYTNPVTSVTSPGDVTINNPVITVNVVNFNPTVTLLCFYCQPKPTGSLRPIVGGTGSEVQHTVRVYPNPLAGNFVHLSIDGKYDDKAIITIIDIYGNTLYVSGEKQIRKGNNLISLNLPFTLKEFSSYFIRVKYQAFGSSIKIIILNN